MKFLRLYSVSLFLAVGLFAMSSCATLGPVGPAILIQFGPFGARVNQVVTFSLNPAMNSSSVNGFVWDFGDGAGANGNPVTHIYSAKGTYKVTLIISFGAASASSESVGRTLQSNNAFTRTYTTTVEIIDVSCLVPSFDDNFDQPNGSPDLICRWEEWIAPDMGNKSITIQNNELRAYCQYTTALGDLGSDGCGLKTLNSFTASSFDVQVKFVSTSGPAFGYGVLAILPEMGDSAENHLAEMNWNVGGGWGGAIDTTPGVPGGITRICGNEQFGLIDIGQSHTFRIVGIPGDKIDFYLDGEFKCQASWNPGINIFKAGFNGRPGGTVGEVISDN